ncbi:MAG: diadenylate cyclase [Schleiferiaceae bacterium]|nr:diadenylate cyclase [Schleiferiaceae bacterium]
MGTLNFGILDALDIIIAAFLLYQVYRLLKGTAAIRILIGMVAIYLLYNLVQLLQMNLLSEILGSFMGAGLIILIIVFQQEIRKFLLVVGSATFSRRRGLKSMFTLGNSESNALSTEAVVSAMKNFSSTKTGVLLILERKDPLGAFAGTGHNLGAAVSRIVLETIFFKNAPLHDGATIITGNTVSAAGAILPLSESSDLPSQFGLRHRAAAGISERTDAVAITVSEETGNMHIFYNGTFEKLTANTLEKKIQEVLAG